MDQHTVIFLGTQGSGKGTQVKLLTEELQKRDPSRNIIYFEAGQALREFGKEGTTFTHKKVDDTMQKGGFQPAFLSSYLMARKFIAEMTCNEHVIIDGFPREPVQAAIFDTAMEYYGRNTPTLFYIYISDDEAVKRLMLRGRNDDTEEGIRKRLGWNRTQMQPILEWFRSNPHYKVQEIDGEHTIEEVHADIMSRLDLS